MKILTLTLATILLVGCGDTNIYNDRGNPNAPSTPGNGTTNKVIVELRVFGNAQSVRVRYSTPLDGLTQVVTTLPYFVTFSTDKTSLFLSLDVTPITFPTGTINPFLIGQIYVDGQFFREASSSDFLSTLSVIGTWRK